MPRGGKREGAGKPKGYTHKNSPNLVKHLTEKYKLTPLEYLTQIYTDTAREDKERIDAAHKALPFFHGKPTIETSSTIEGGGFTLNITEPKDD